MINETGIAHLIDPSYKKVFYDNLTAEPPVYSQIFNIVPSSHAWEKLSGFTGVGLVPVKTEGGEAIFDTPRQKVAKTFTHVTHSLGVRVTDESYNDDLSGNLMKIPRALAQSSRATLETKCGQHFDRSQTGAYTGADGKVMCATDHPVYGDAGSAWSNRPTTNVDLSVSALESAITALRTTANDQGIVTSMRAATLLVPAANLWMAAQLMDNPEKSGTTNRDINAIKMKNRMNVIVWDYLTDTDSWYILTDKQDLQLFFFMRQAIRGWTYDAPDNTDDAIFRSKFRFSSGWLNPLGIYGSIGA